MLRISSLAKGEYGGIIPILGLRATRLFEESSLEAEETGDGESPQKGFLVKYFFLPPSRKGFKSRALTSPPTIHVRKEMQSISSQRRLAAKVVLVSYAAD
jgi:hypothetical protein